MRVYLDTGVFIDYLSSRDQSCRLLRRQPRRGRDPNQLAQDAEAVLRKLRDRGHDATTSCLTCFEIEEAIYRELVAAVPPETEYAKRLLIPAARCLGTQIIVTQRLFKLKLSDLSEGILSRALGNLEFQLDGVRAGDALHLATAMAVDAELVISADEHMLELHARLQNSTGVSIACVDTHDALMRL